MAAGRQHQKGYLIGLAILMVAGVVLAGTRDLLPQDVAALLLGGVLGMLIDPDVRDQHNITTRGERRMWGLPIIGPIVGYVFEVYWYPLARWIPHRSFLSHMPVVGTAIAALWLTIWPALAYYYLGGMNVVGPTPNGLGSAVPFLEWYVGLYQPWMLLTFLAWCFQDSIHLAQDGFRITFQIFGTSPFSRAH